MGLFSVKEKVVVLFDNEGSNYECIVKDIKEGFLVIYDFAKSRFVWVPMSNVLRIEELTKDEYDKRRNKSFPSSEVLSESFKFNVMDVEDNGEDNEFDSRFFFDEI